MTDLGTLGGTDSTGAAVNSSGQVTGDAFTAGNAAQRAFLYSNGVMTDLGTLGGADSSGRALNSSGQVTGSAQTFQGTQHAFSYSDGTMTDLGTLGGDLSEGYAINSAGLVTGTSRITGNTTDHAFLYSNGSMIDLNSLIDPSSPLAAYVTLTEGTAINDSGWIVANGVDSRTGPGRAYLLTPVP
jgi:probable HAF family extracellular repeat protein